MKYKLRIWGTDFHGDSILSVNIHYHASTSHIKSCYRIFIYLFLYFPPYTIVLNSMMVGLYLHECSKLFVGRIRTQGICGSQKKATTELTA